MNSEIIVRCISDLCNDKDWNQYPISNNLLNIHRDFIKEYNYLSNKSIITRMIERSNTQNIECTDLTIDAIIRMSRKLTPHQDFNIIIDHCNSKYKKLDILFQKDNFLHVFWKLTNHF